MSADVQAGASLFGGGFGDDDGDTFGAAEDTANASDEDNESDEGTASEDEDAAAAAVAALQLEDSATPTWYSSVPYSPFYVRNIGEYLPPAERDTAAEDAILDEADSKPSKSGPKGEFNELKWAMEAYEQSMKVDSLFERFVQRTNLEPTQCLRYDFGGAPLPYQADRVYDELFPQPVAGSGGVPVTRPDFVAGSAAPKRSFTSDRLPRCPSCNALRSFECQLMPNVINVLKAAKGKTTQTDEERKAELERVLVRKGVTDERGTMEWGTCMVFSCSKDCTSGKEPVAVWREEHVLVQWEA